MGGGYRGPNYDRMSEFQVHITEEVLKRIFDQLFEEIKHGDEEHQLWLKNKMDEYLKGYLSWNHIV